MENKETVCAVVVTYNRKKLLKECLEALIKQTRPIQAIYLIDNASTDGTPDLLLEKDYIKELPPKNLSKPWEKEFEIKNLTDEDTIKLYYVRMHENTGGAGGFHEGVKRGYERGYDWLWLMDDDAEPKEDALEKKLNQHINKNVLVLADLKVGPDGRIQYKHRGYKNICNLKSNPIKPIGNNIGERTYIDHCSFVGFMVNRRGISLVGLPRKEFFIHYDDVEYSFRLRKVGKILLVKDSIIIHKENASKNLENKKVLFRKSKRIPYKSLWLHYYGFRNLIYLKKTECNILIALLVGVLILLRNYIGILIYNDDHKFKRIRFFYNAFLDGLIGRFDNKKPKRLLYE